MGTTAIAIRTAKASDAEGVAAVHDAAWRFAYRGILPGAELERMIARRGPDWWHRALTRRVAVVVLEVAGAVRGYVTFGPCRLRTLPHDAEIYELYIDPDHIGLGFGRRLFRTVEQRLARRGRAGLMVWCLSDNEPGCRFYEGLGGRVVARAQERFGGRVLGKTGYGFAMPGADDRFGRPDAGWSDG